MRRRFLLAALLLAATPALADVSADLAKIEARQKACLDKDESNAGMSDCADAARAAADTLLNKTYEAAVATLKQAGDDDAREKPRRLVASERAWIACRDAQCQFEGVAMLGGSGEGLAIGTWLAEKTKARVKAIAEVLDGP